MTQQLPTLNKIPSTTGVFSVQNAPKSFSISAMALPWRPGPC